MIKILIIPIFVFLFHFCYSQSTNVLIEGNTQFAFELYQNLLDSNSENNIFFSPYSISEVLAITYGGAKSNTEKQMQRVLHFSENQSLFHANFHDLRSLLNKRLDSLVLKSSNSLWVQKGYPARPDFIAQSKLNYDALINYVNYTKNGARKKAVTTINTWVEDNTNNKIKGLLTTSDLGKNTRMVIVNAVWFYGEWIKSFDVERTSLGVFQSKAGEQEILFMQKEDKFLYYTDDMIQVLQIPYKSNRQSLLIFLPQPEIGFNSFEKSFDGYYLDNIIKDMQWVTVNVRLPKFSSDYSLDLKENLMQLGIKDAFSNQADFSGINTQNDLKIDKIIHKARIELSEKGTEAAVATAVVMIRKSATIHQLEFNADRPFVYLIRDNETGTILFFGRYVKVQ